VYPLLLDDPQIPERKPGVPAGGHTAEYFTRQSFSQLSVGHESI